MIKEISSVTDKEYNKQWNNILDNMRWKRIQKTMKALDWAWVDTDGKTPSIGRIMRSASDLCEQAWDLGTTLSSGGFEAQVCKDLDGVKTLSLKFVIDRWDGYFD